MRKSKTRQQQEQNKRSRKALARRLARYSLTAGAALAVAPQVQGAVVYSGPLDQDFGPGIGTVGIGELPVTVEGTAHDLLFQAGTGGMGHAQFLRVGRYGGTAGDASILAISEALPPPFTNTVPLVVPVFSSKSVGPTGMTPDHSVGFMRIQGSHATHGPFEAGHWESDGYLGYVGFSFMSESNPDLRLYGWTLVERLDPANGRLLRWAYEDTGGPIHVPAVPEPSSLALLALGAAGVAARRKRSEA